MRDRLSSQAFYQMIHFLTDNTRAFLLNSNTYSLTVKQATLGQMNLSTRKKIKGYLKQLVTWKRYK